MTLIETAHPERIRETTGFDAGSFDAVAFLPRARQMARRIYPDAQLITFDVSGVGANGRANLRLSKNFEATYNFLSRSHDRPELPENSGEDIPCWVYVEVDKEAATARIVEQESCKGKARPNPRCSMRQVWEKAFALGAPRSGVVAKIDYLWDGWYFSIDSRDINSSIPDDC